MPSEDEEELLSLTVTIALDNDDGLKGRGHLYPTTSLVKFYSISPPISAHHACPKPPRNTVVANLPPDAQKLLCNRLNAPSIGSMKNWEYLSAVIGVSNDEQLSMRRSRDPMYDLLVFASHLSLESLVTAIGDIQRIDVLISLRPFIQEISSNKNFLLNVTPLSRHPQLSDSALMETSKVSLFSTLKKRYIIVTHHETASADKKDFKLFFKNVVTYAKEKNVDVLDINKCIDETNISQTGSTLFKNATHIVLFLASPDYVSLISDPEKAKINSDDPVIRLKRLFNCWMEEEYNSNGCKNYRFRVIINRTVTTLNEVMPSGWPNTTIQYKFPTSFSKFCDRIFDE